MLTYLLHRTCRKQIIMADKLDVFVTADTITSAVSIKFDRKPEKAQEMAFVAALKTMAMGAWSPKLMQWDVNKEKIVEAFETKEFRARLKSVARGITFYSPKGTSVNMMEWLDDVKNFDPDALDDDLASLPQAIKREPSPPSTPSTSTSKKSRAA